MNELTLLRRRHPLASAAAQRALLEADGDLPRFEEHLERQGIAALHAGGIDVLQVNVGKTCNQTCRHCHVDAGPDRRESMSAEVAEACLRLLERASIGVLDITGGAPEMNPNFRRLATEARRLHRRVIDRCNLTILVAPGYEDLPQFLATQEVELIASLPCYLGDNVDRQRGDHAFERSICALRLLNALGYGQPGSGLVLRLVFNPQGPTLPPVQARLEADYRRELRARYGIEFTSLITITNMPISRFLEDLQEQGSYDGYMQKLAAAFNAETIGGLMCRSMVSVDWQGNLYDCDFNQMLEMPISGGRALNVCNLEDRDLANLRSRRIRTGRHCLGCTAGAGSSCSGALAAPPGSL